MVNVDFGDPRGTRVIYIEVFYLANELIVHLGYFSEVPNTREALPKILVKFTLFVELKKKLNIELNESIFNRISNCFVIKIRDAISLGLRCDTSDAG